MSSEPVIWKYQCPEPESHQDIEMPEGARVVKVHDGHMWAIIPDTGARLVDRMFATVGTGTPIAHDPADAFYVGTWFDTEAEEVWHVLEIDRG